MAGVPYRKVWLVLIVTHRKSEPLYRWISSESNEDCLESSYLTLFQLLVVRIEDRRLDGSVDWAKKTLVGKLFSRSSTCRPGVASCFCESTEATFEWWRRVRESWQRADPQLQTTNKFRYQPLGRTKVFLFNILRSASIQIMAK
jgi:hypothetical protein